MYFKSLVLLGHGGMSSLQAVVLHLQRNILSLHLQPSVIHLHGERVCMFVRKREGGREGESRRGRGRDCLHER